VNALRLPAKIGVEGANHDTCVIGRSMLMQAEKVTPIVGQQDPAASCGERQNCGVRHGGIRIPGIRRGDNIVPQPPQLCDHLQRDIFVGIETGHALGDLVLANLRLNLFGMRARIGPSVYQILCSEMRVCTEQGLLARAQATGLLKQPNWNTGANDARFTAAHIRSPVDTWKIVIKLPNHPLENLSLLPTGESRQHFLELAQARHGFPNSLSPMRCGLATAVRFSGRP
jgi:hypothetical protein